MANLPEARRTIYILLAIFLALDVVAVIVMLTPVAGSGAALQKEFDSVRQQVKNKQKLVVPPEQVQDRVNTARKQIAEFYDERMPAQASEVVTELGKLATANNVHLLSARYSELESDVPGLARMRIDANVTGDYLQEVKFINSVERSKQFFVIDSVSLGAAQQPGSVRLAVTLETYLKGEAQ